MHQLVDATAPVEEQVCGHVGIQAVLKVIQDESNLNPLSLLVEPRPQHAGALRACFASASAVAAVGGLPRPCSVEFVRHVRTTIFHVHHLHLYLPQRIESRHQPLDSRGLCKCLCLRHLRGQLVVGVLRDTRLAEPRFPYVLRHVRRHCAEIPANRRPLLPQPNAADDPIVVQVVVANGQAAEVRDIIHAPRSRQGRGIERSSHTIWHRGVVAGLHGLGVAPRVLHHER
mmetsp:Transcript_65093/g.183774  ORF Transcript_65093/g.183774 Transcript_65093/m.183774 type:complete len:229 (+) Transcript_65093:598-1284(+)